MAGTEPSTYFTHISIGAVNNIVHLVSFLLNAGAQPKYSSKDFVPHDWLSKISKEVVSLLLSA